MFLSIYLTDADKRAVCFRSRGRRVHVSVFSSATRLQAQLPPLAPPLPVSRQLKGRWSRWMEAEIGAASRRVIVGLGGGWG